MDVNSVRISITDGCPEHHYDQHYSDDKIVPVRQLLTEIILLLFWWNLTCKRLYYVYSVFGCNFMFSNMCKNVLIKCNSSYIIVLYFFKLYTVVLKQI